VFLPDRSWVKPGVLASRVESERILRHEQTHFNITEVHARRMRRYFAQVYDPCGKSDAQMKDAVDRFVREEADAQQRYDAGTRFGLAPDEQRASDREVAELLASLSAFASREGRSAGPRDAGTSHPAPRTQD
jgi:hypothetical protein